MRRRTRCSESSMHCAGPLPHPSLLTSRVLNVDPILNRELLANNTCFGCGLENPTGLHIEIYHEPGSQGTLRARFTPTENMGGFPGVTHGGAIYTALDCLSTWVATLLGPRSEERRVGKQCRTGCAAEK